MSNRTMIEINHDFSPYTDEEQDEFLRGMLAYMASGDPMQLPPGVTWFGMRHHTEPCPLGTSQKGWKNRAG